MKNIKLTSEQIAEHAMSMERDEWNKNTEIWKAAVNQVDGNFKLLNKYVLTFSSMAFGAASAIGLAQIADFHFLCISWVAFFCSLTTILIECLISIFKAEQAARTADDEDKQEIDNTPQKVLIILSVVFILLGVLFFMLSMFVGLNK